jgi:glycosyltransferase involved in cell wall biosynthesis
MKKILVIMLSRGVGGLERRTSCFYHYLQSVNLRGCRIEFLVNRAQFKLINQYTTSAANKNVTLTAFGLPGWFFQKKSGIVLYLMDYFLLALKLLLMRLKRRSFDLTYFTKFSSLPFKKLINTKSAVIAAVDSYNSKRYTDSSLFLKELSKGLKVDCLSDSIKNYIIALKPFSDFSSQINATPCSFIDYSKTSIVKKEKVVCFSGRFTGGKGLDLIIAAIPLVLERHPDIAIWLLGEGPLQPLLDSFIQKEKVRSYHIHFEQNPTEYLKRSLVFLSLQEKENYPSQALLEAMACGNAIVATDVGDTRKLVNESNGILVNPEPQCIAKAVCQLLDNPEKALRLGRNARETVINNHNTERYFTYLKNTYCQ